MSYDLMPHLMTDLYCLYESGHEIFALVVENTQRQLEFWPQYTGKQTGRRLLLTTMVLKVLLHAAKQQAHNVLFHGRKKNPLIIMYSFIGVERVGG